MVGTKVVKRNFSSRSHEFNKVKTLFFKSLNYFIFFLNLNSRNFSLKKKFIYFYEIKKIKEIFFFIN